MTDIPPPLPPLPPFNEDGYRTREPAISFTIERIVFARRKEIYRAWTDPELFKRWIIPPSQELVSLSVDAGGNADWSTKGQADDDASVEYVLAPQTPQPYKAMETQFFTSAVPGMMYGHPVYLYLDLDKRQ